MKIIPLSEGSFTIDKSKIFIPFDKQLNDLQQRAVGSLLVEIQPFVIVTKKDVLLLDTGLGFVTNDGVLQLYQNLRSMEIDPMSVTKVLISHLHKDHAGGIQAADQNIPGLHLNFPNANYYVNENELAFAMENKNSSYDPGQFSLLLNSGKLITLNDKGSIDNYITYELSKGHSQYHMVYWIREDSQVIFYGGDVAPQLQQMKTRFVAKYDFDGQKSMELRSQWWETGLNEHWTFLFYHDISSPIVTL